MRFPVVLIAVVVLAACSGAGDSPENGEQAGYESLPTGGAAPRQVAEQAAAVEVRASWMRPHPGGRDVTAAYFAAQLSEGTGDLLLAARIDGAARVELHGHTMDSDGVMQMREIGAQRLTDDGPLVFTPGGRHLMVFGLPTVVEGDEVTGVLVFQNAGEVPVTFTVQSMPPGQVTDY